jgi:beta-glucosidase
MNPLPFPAGFLWGAATSSHQVEGGNVRNDWWAWEERTQPSAKRSGQACDQWNCWKEDVDLMQELGHNAHRLSLEWSHIEPQEGVFDEAALTHYKKLLQALRARGIKTIVTLHHFTNPQWLSEKGGWLQSCVVKQFTRYAEVAVKNLGTEIDVLLTINEPGVYAFMSYQAGLWPPQEKSSWKMLRVLRQMARAHRATYAMVKRHFPTLQVGIAQNMTTFEAVHPNSLRERFAAHWMSLFNNLSFYWLSGWKTHDLLGVNYYFHRRLDVTGKLWPTFQDPKETQRTVSDLGWELFPEGLGRIVRALKKYQKPVLITEHGLADADDSRRPAFLYESLRHLSLAWSEGVPVIGYLHWSLLDNFEWADGFTPRFGLVEVEYATQKRTPRPSALLYRTLIQKSTPSPHGKRPL